jgi:hypothetical protein
MTQNYCFVTETKILYKLILSLKTQEQQVLQLGSLLFLRPCHPVSSPDYIGTCLLQCATGCDCWHFSTWSNLHLQWLIT